MNSLDLPALRARLREYDPALPRCSGTISETRNFATEYMSEENRAEWDMTFRHPCGRPDGHEGPCRSSRAVLGWPGFETLTALLDEVEQLRAERAEAEAAGEARERARIGAFLHAEARWIKARPALHELLPYDALNIVGEAVESGEYRDTKENP